MKIERTAENEFRLTLDESEFAKVKAIADEDNVSVDLVMTCCIEKGMDSFLTLKSRKE